MTKLETQATPVNEGMSGTHDDVPPASQMEAIDRALMLYFGTSNWLFERNRIMPGLGGRLDPECNGRGMNLD